MKVFLLIVIISLIEYVGDSSLKEYARKNTLHSLVIGITTYAILVYGIILVLRQTNVIYMNTMWDSVSALIESLLAMILLGETLSNGIQYYGMAMVIVGIFLLNVGKIPY